jgi:hypothetical protein
MSADPNKKSARTFQCRDVLWETFEQMARELECSVDYLINEAMKQYARQRSYGGASRTPFPPQQQQQSQPPAQAMHGSYGAPPMQGMPPYQPSGPVPPPPGMRQAPLGPPPSQRMPPPPMRQNSSLPAPPPPPPRGMHGVSAPPQRNMGGSMGGMQGPRSAPPPPRSVPPPIPRGPTPLPPQPMGGMGANGYPAPAGHAGALSVIYQGEKLPVTKDRFVIGRGKQSSDLTLKDPNVSRQHAMIEFQNGVYFMVDMGSTNGVEYNGQRIARKQITEGDVFKICDHEMRFTYR